MSVFQNQKGGMGKQACEIYFLLLKMEKASVKRFWNRFGGLGKERVMVALHEESRLPIFF